MASKEIVAIKQMSYGGKKSLEVCGLVVVYCLITCWSCFALHHPHHIVTNPYRVLLTMCFTEMAGHSARSEGAVQPRT